MTKSRNMELLVFLIFLGSFQGNNVRGVSKIWHKSDLREVTVTKILAISSMLLQPNFMLPSLSSQLKEVVVPKGQHKSDLQEVTRSSHVPAKDSIERSRAYVGTFDLKRPIKSCKLTFEGSFQVKCSNRSCKSPLVLSKRSFLGTSLMLHSVRKYVLWSRF